MTAGDGSLRLIVGSDNSARLFVLRTLLLQFNDGSLTHVRGLGFDDFLNAVMEIMAGMNDMAN
jgi:hypothetical protein